MEDRYVGSIARCFNLIWYWFGSDIYTLELNRPFQFPSYLFQLSPPTKYSIEVSSINWLLPTHPEQFEVFRKARVGLIEERWKPTVFLFSRSIWRKLNFPTQTPPTKKRNGSLAIDFPEVRERDTFLTFKWKFICKRLSNKFV